MANIVVSIEKGIEIGAADALKWLMNAGKPLRTAPAVIAALATMAGALEKPLAELASAAANPLNVPLDVQTAMDLKSAWPEVKAFLQSLGVRVKTADPAPSTVLDAAEKRTLSKSTSEK